MTVDYSPTPPLAGQPRNASPTEVERWTDYADTIADVGTRFETIEADAASLGSGAAADGLVLTTDGTGGTVWEAPAGGSGGTVDVVSNVAQDRVLGRVSAGSGDSEELTAAQVRTLLGALDVSGARAYKNTGTQPIASGSHQAVTLNAEHYDDDGYHDTATNNSRFTIPTTGRYRIDGSVDMSPSAGGTTRLATIWKNGVSTGTRLANSAQAPNSGFSSRIPIATGPINLVAGDYIELAMYQDSGSPLDVNGTALGDMTWLSIERVG